MGAGVECENERLAAPGLAQEVHCARELAGAGLNQHDRLALQNPPCEPAYLQSILPEPRDKCEDRPDSSPGSQAYREDYSREDRSGCGDAGEADEFEKRCGEGEKSCPGQSA